MNEFWVKDGGTIPESQAAELIRAYSSAGRVCLAFFSDHFESVQPEQVQERLTDCTNLLQLRIFDRQSELWMHRSTLGESHPFHWRIADDTVLSSRVQNLEDDFLQNAEHHMIREIQYLEETGRDRAAECLPLQSGETAVQVIVYVRYDERGIAIPADYRLSGFTASDVG